MPEPERVLSPEDEADIRTELEAALRDGPDGAYFPGAAYCEKLLAEIDQLRAARQEAERNLKRLQTLQDAKDQLLRDIRGALKDYLRLDLFRRRDLTERIDICLAPERARLLAGQPQASAGTAADTAAAGGE